VLMFGVETFVYFAVWPGMFASVPWKGKTNAGPGNNLVFFV
jgi:hypothetical protein